MEEAVAWLIGGLIGIVVAVFAVWTVAVAVLKIVAYTLYVIPVVIVVVVVAGVVFSLVTTGWVFWGGGKPVPVVYDPNKVVAKEVFSRDATGPSKAYGWDWAWPAYLPYQVIADLRAVHATQLGIASAYFRSTFTKISSTSWPTKLICYPIAGFLLGLFAASVTLVSSLTVVVLAIPFACAMVVRWLLIYGLRGLDVAYRTARRSSAKCPECYEPTTLPSFECPNGSCSTVHRDIRPGRLGVVVRRCGCGATLPTMVVRASLAKLLAKCPSCNANLTAGAGTRRTIQMPVFGTIGSGKTRFMLAATVGLGQKLDEQGGSLTGTGAASQAQLEQARQLIAQRANTVKTAAALPQAFGLIADPAEGRSVELHLFDAAGELFETWDSTANLRYLQSAEGLIFIIDPLTTAAAKASLTRLGAKSVLVGTGSPGDAYDNAVEHLRAAGANLKGKALAVVLTKADVLFKLPVAGDLQAGDGASIRHWLVDNELDSLIERTRLDFRSVKFFIVDSLDSANPSAPLSPYRPLAWLLAEVKANVVRPDVEPAVVHAASSPTVATPIPEMPVQAAGGNESDWGRT